jgi:hypothetical protein
LPASASRTPEAPRSQLRDGKDPLTAVLDAFVLGDTSQQAEVVCPDRFLLAAFPTIRTPHNAGSGRARALGRRARRQSYIAYLAVQDGGLHSKRDEGVAVNDFTDIQFAAQRFRCAFAFGRVLQYISWSRSHREGGGSLPLRNETHRAKTCKRNSTSGTPPFLRTGGGWPTHRMSRERFNRDHPPWRIKNWRSVIFS